MIAYESPSLGSNLLVMIKKSSKLFHVTKQFLLQNSSIKQTMLKNTFWLMFAEGITRLLMFFVTVWIARYLGVRNFGEFTFAFAFTALFGVFADFGFNSVS